MDIRYELNGLSFVWDARKAAANPIRLISARRAIQEERRTHEHS